jgi:hypothetical protein
MPEKIPLGFALPVALGAALGLPAQPSFSQVAQAQTDNHPPAVATEGRSGRPLEGRGATSSFTAPAGCIDDATLARTVGAVQACIQRFSATHEFVTVLKEIWLRRTHDDIEDAETLPAKAVHDYIETMRAANEGRQDQVLGMFEWTDTKKEGWPVAADHCSLVSMAVIDHGVPGHEGEEFRLWGQSFVCARLDESDNSIQLVELRSSERFRVATDDFKERFTYLEPAGSALEAAKTLRMY